MILKILRNEKYCGDLKQKKTITPDYLTHRKQYNHGEEEFIFLQDHHPPIVSRELWEEAQREIARRDMDGKYAAGHGSRYPLSGKIKCGECGRSFVSRTRHRKDGSRYKVWRCGTAAAEGSRHIDPAGNVVGCDVGCLLRDEVGLEMVRQAVALLDLDAQTLSRSIVQAALKAVSDPHSRSGTRLEDLTKELEQVIKKKKGVLDAFFAKHITAEDMKLMNAEYDRQATCLTQKIQAAEAQKELTNDPSTLESKIQKAVEAIVLGRTASEKLYGDLLNHITVYPDKRMEVRLKLLPGKWTFALTSQTDRKP